MVKSVSGRLRDAEEDHMFLVHALLITVMLVVSMGAPAQAQKAKPSTRKPASEQPKLAQQLFYDGFEAYKANCLKDAIGLFEKGLQQDPTNALATFYLGEAYTKTGNPAKAQQWYGASLAADPQSEVAAQARERVAAAPRGTTPPPAATETVEFINGLYACQTKQSHEAGFNEIKARFSLIDGYKLRSTEEVHVFNVVKGYGIEILDYVYQAEANLADLEPSVHAEKQHLRVSCNPSKGACFATSQNGKRRWDTNGGSSTSPINENDSANAQFYSLCFTEDAPRAVKAFHHLITSSGGKKSLF
jgi:tetratricopeptide (TPR) repeat protein